MSDNMDEWQLTLRNKRKLEQQLAEHKMQIVMLRDALEYIRDKCSSDPHGWGAAKAKEALAATADLKDCILCDAEPVGRYEGTNPESGEQAVWIDCGIDAGTMLYRARTK